MFMTWLIDGFAPHAGKRHARRGRGVDPVDGDRSGHHLFLFGFRRRRFGDGDSRAGHAEGQERTRGARCNNAHKSLPRQNCRMKSELNE